MTKVTVAQKRKWPSSRNQILEQKNSINGMKNAKESNGNKAVHMEERISEIKDRNLEMIQMEKEREIKFV